MGCGLGGTSLINANVVIEAEPRVFENPAWPEALVDDLADGIATGYRRAREMLKPNPYPEAPTWPKLKKLSALEQSAKAIGKDFYRPPIAVNFESLAAQTNHVGVHQAPCVLCGDCCSGCNYSAKNTVQMNYLPDAANHGAEIFTELSVRYIESRGDQWLVHYEVVGAERQKFDAPDLFVRADVVVLAAGTLGSSEILLRSKERGLALSDEVGKRFTGNGDVLAFGYNTDQEINGIGWGTRKPDHDNPVGPTITGIIDTRRGEADYRDGMSIEEGAMPGALSPMLPLPFATLTKLFGKDMDDGFFDFVREKKRELESMLLGSYRGAIDNTQTFLVMTHDSGTGVIRLEDDRPRITWPDVGEEEIFRKVKDRLREIVEALGGTYMPNPIQTRLLGHDLITVHPLGGCAMSEQASTGVVNHKGQVFASSSGGATHKGLYVADGAIMPTSLGTNPLLTISALAERNVALLADDYGWQIDYSLPSKPPSPPATLRAGIQFTETMTGYFSTDEKTSYEKAHDLGEQADSTFRFTLTVISDDLDRMLSDEQHEARMVGTVDAPALSSEPLTVSDGVFNLFVHYPDEVGARRMRYRMKLHSEAGDVYFFEGHKVIRDDPGIDLWSDTTTLYITVHAGNDEHAAVLGKGMLRIRPVDFMKQMTTMKVRNARSIKERLTYTARFGTFFAGTLFDTYGGIVTGQHYFNPKLPPRKKRVLDVSCPPQVHDFKTDDGAQLRLTRYQCGAKGPVILSHGLGVSSRIYSMDTFDTNLLEYLAANRYDVWLLDYRASIELPAANTRFSADDIARYDYPAAVQTVRRLTGAPTVQMVVHCYGSTAWTISMLGGWLDGVRSAVCSQVSTHMKVPLLTKIKTGLHVPTFLDALGIDSLTAYVDEESSWTDKFFDHALRLYPVQPEERCNNPVCLASPSCMVTCTSTISSTRSPMSICTKCSVSPTSSHSNTWHSCRAKVMWSTLKARMPTFPISSAWPSRSHSFQAVRTRPFCRRARRLPTIFCARRTARACTNAL